MGIYDRDYYRREGPSYLGSFMDRGKVCKWLILINVGCFVLQMFSPAFQGTEGQQSLFTEIMQLDAQAVLNGQVWRLLTHAFMHAGPMHILFNMLALWMFGSTLEQDWGSRRLMEFYFFCVVGAGLVTVAMAYTHLLGMRTDVPTVGASGGIYGLIVVR